MTTAAANSTTTGTLPANTLLRVLGASIVTITRGGAVVATQSTERDNFVGPYPTETSYSVVAGGTAIDISVKDGDGVSEALVPAKISTDAAGNTVLVGADGITAIVDGKQAPLASSVSIWDADVSSGDIGTSDYYLDVPSPYYFGAHTADRDGYALSQTLGAAGNLTLTGSQPTLPLEVTLYSTANLSGVTFTITGTGIGGVAQTQAIAGPNNTTTRTTKAFLTVTQIAASAAVGTAVEAGWNDGVEGKSIVHPSIVYEPEGWNGYKYWLAYTPYRAGNVATENPCIAASNDYQVWDTPAANPVVPAPVGSAYLSDVHLYMLPDKSKLLMMYRDSGVVAGHDQLLVTETTDGRTWSTPVVIWSFVNSAGNPRLISPSFFHDGTNWVIYAHDNNDAAYALKRMARAGDYASLYDDWSALTPVAVTLTNPRGESWWHSCLIRLENGRIIGTASDNDSGAGQLWLLQSDDGTTFSVKEFPFSNNQFYRNSLHVETDATGQADKLVITAGTVTSALAPPTYRFYRVALPLIGKIAARQNAVLAAQNVYSLNANDKKSLILAADVFTGSAGTNVVTSSDGKTWVQADTNNVQYDGTGKATNENTSNCIATIDVGQADYSAQMTYSVRASTGQAFLVFRQVDGNNRWRFGCSDAGGRYDLQSIIGGAVVDNIGIAGVTQADGDVLRVECDGTRIQAYVNGRMVYALNSTLNLTGKLCGLQLRHPTLALTVMVDDFMVHKLS